jgi:hypothetical protein
MLAGDTLHKLNGSHKLWHCAGERVLSWEIQPHLFSLLPSLDMALFGNAFQTTSFIDHKS